MVIMDNELKKKQCYKLYLFYTVNISMLVIAVISFPKEVVVLQRSKATESSERKRPSLPRQGVCLLLFLLHLFFFTSV